ncbi:MAG: PTS transporter subunit EIIC [Solobacterium sp.]|nr:PTS transporter subunit EIIC [Solobacterium sp.]
MFTLFAGTPIEMPVFKTFLGIPIIFPATGYTSTVIPIMMVNFLASKIEKTLKQVLPRVTRQFMVPFFTILFAGIVGVLLVGPISMIIQNLLQAGLNSLISTSKILAFAVITLIYQPLVIFGLHWPLITLGIMEYGSLGNSLIVASIFPASFAHMAACFAVFLKSKDIKTKNIALPAFLSACFCIIEPSIYGVTLPVKKRFGFCMIGGLVGGLILALSNSPMYAISMGVTGVMSFINPNVPGIGGLVWAIIACIAAMLVTFTLTFVTYQDTKEVK